ncbi:MAG TPA: TrmH family RNA methyltransferase [Oscillatoriaceae cyanobacterium]
MSALLARTRVILLRPSLPENVGAVARSMAHFGLRELVLVEGVSPTHPHALAVSAGHEPLLHAARRVDTFEEALDGTGLVVGTTARTMPGVDRRAIAPDDGATLARDHGGRVALVFGTERTGMTNAELRRCHQVMTIPGEAEACLNLAQAATICFYEWRLASETPVAGERPLDAVAAEAGLVQLAERLAEALATAGILKPREHASKLHTLRRILSRARLSPDEAAMIASLTRAYLQHRVNEQAP